eukprot:15219481-Ditylum_brightwellii.AAC.1
MALSVLLFIGSATFRKTPLFVSAPTLCNDEIWFASSSRLEVMKKCVSPTCIDVNITGEVVEKVARRLSGAAGPGGVDSVSLQDWLLQYGEVSRKLCGAIPKFARWIANTYPPWAAIRAYVAGLLIGLDKCPGARPVGIGEALQRLVGKALLFVCGAEEAAACGADQLCGGLRSGIEGGIHAMNDLWNDYGDNDEWGILLVDVCNAFDELNCMAMLWHVRHVWPLGCIYAFNTYRHRKILVVRGGSKHLQQGRCDTGGSPCNDFVCIGCSPNY